MTRIIISLMLCFSIIVGIVEARILNVPEDFQTIQAGIDASEDGDTVLVAPGTYEENLIINRSNIVIGSEILTTGNPAYIDSTIIDGRNNGSTVRFDWHENIVIRGLTITNGSGTGHYRDGGGIYSTGSPRFEDLRITGNHGGDGGGFSASGGAPVLIRVLIDHNTGNNGAGARFSGGRPELYDCVVRDNEATILPGLTFYESDPILRGVAVVDNHSVEGGGLYGGVALFGGGNNQPIVFDHVTIASNTGSQRQWSGGIHMASVGRGLQLTNSIIYGNDGDNEIVQYDGDDGGEPCSLSVSYSNIQGGENGVWVVGISGMVWLDGNMDADPRFINAGEGDYHLESDSPCIDAGDPDSPPDPDGTRADMGAFPLRRIIASANGRAYDAITDEPLSGLVVTSDEGFGVMGDSLGVWSLPIYGSRDSLRVVLRLRVPRYVPIVLDTMFHFGDTLWFESRFHFANFVPSIDSLVVEVDSGGVLRVPLTFLNDQEGTLSWSAVGKAVGDAGLPDMHLRDSLQISTITGDDRIEGATFDGERFYLSGANGNDENLIYVVSREGALVDSFPQVGSTRYGYKDVDWDGENLWVAGEDSVYCLSTDGEVIAGWDEPNNHQYIACDPRDGILWMAGTTSDIFGYDRRGNNLGRILDNQNMRIYGLGCASFDPDGARLFIINKPISNNPTTNLTKMNTETGDTLFVRTLPVDDGSTGFQSAFVCNNYDIYRGSVLIILQNRNSENGGDRLDVYQLQGNNEWLSIEPDHGEVPAGREEEATIVLKTVSDDSLWAFSTGEYEGEVVFTHDGMEGSFVLPVTMQVVEPTGVESDKGEVYPRQIEISAYPNPFNAMTRIRYSTGLQAAPTRLAVYGVDGRLVTDLTVGDPPFNSPPASKGGNEENLFAGTGENDMERSVIWDASNQPAGVYFVRLEAGKEVKTIKTVLMK